MEAVAKGNTYALRNPRTKEIVRFVNARDVFDRSSILPGRMGTRGSFSSTGSIVTIPSRIGEIESTNPCGEQPLLPYESCNLGSINLANMVKGGAVGLGKARVHHGKGRPFPG